MGDFGGYQSPGERPGHERGYFADQDRGRDLAKEVAKARRAKRPDPWWRFWRRRKRDDEPA
jgi:hypothetical protein